MIHPTAIIDQSAQIADTAEIGPMAYVGPGCKIGANVKIGVRAIVEAHTEIGEGTVLHANAHVGGAPQDISFKNEETRLVIGKNCTIREFATINRASTKENWVTTVGDNLFMMANAHIAHDCIVGNNVIMVNGCMIAGHTHVGNNVLISGLVGVHQFCHIGDYVTIGGLTKIVQDVPPYMLADGHPAEIRNLNAVGLKRGPFTPAARKALKEAFRLYTDRSILLADFVKALETDFDQIPEIVNLRNFFADTRRSYLRRT